MKPKQPKEFKLKQEPVHAPCRTARQMELAIVKEIAHKKNMTHGDLIEHIIKLYGAELEKANAEIHRLRQLVELR